MGQLEKLGMRHVIGDEAVYYWRINDKTEGTILLHVDDMMVSGSELFYDKVINQIKKEYKFSKIEKN